MLTGPSLYGFIVKTKRQANNTESMYHDISQSFQVNFPLSITRLGQMFQRPEKKSHSTCINTVQMPCSSAQVLETLECEICTLISKLIA